MEITKDTPVWFINRTTGRVGKTKPVIAGTIDKEDGKQHVQVVFEIPKKEQKHNFEWFWNEDDWLEEVKKL